MAQRSTAAATPTSQKVKHRHEPKPADAVETAVSIGAGDLAQKFMDSTQEIIFAVDRQYRLLYSNRAHQQAILAGGSAGISIGQSVLSDLCPADMSELYRKALERCYTGESCSVEREIVLSDGLHYIESMFNSLRDEQGKLIGAFVTERDVTAHRRTKETLRQTEKRLCFVEETSSDLIFILDLQNSNWLYISPAIKQLLGYDADIALRKPLKDFFPDSDWPLLQKRWPKRIAGFKKGKTRFNVDEFELIHQNGSKIRVEVSSHIRLDSQTGHLALHGSLRDLSQRRQAHEDLRKLNERLVLATRAARMGIWDWDIVNNILEWDDNMYELYGRTKAEHGGAYESWLSAIHPENFDQAFAASQMAVRGEKEYDTTFTIALPNGTQKHIKAFGNVYRDENGKALRMIGVNFDITEMVIAEKALQESEAKFQNAFQYAPIGMLMASLETKFIKVNTALCNMLGYSETELLSKTRQDISHPADFLNDLDSLERLKDGTLNMYQTEKRYIHKSGRIVWGSISVSMIRDDQGRPRFYIIQIQDITEKKKAEEALRKSEEKWRTIIKTSPDGIAIVSNQGLLQYVSDTMLKLHGCEKEQEMIGRHFLEFFDPAEHETAQYRLAQLLNGKRLGAREFKVLRTDGRPLYVELAAEILRDQNGQAESIFAIERDVTERRQTLTELNHVNQHLEEVVEQRTREIRQLSNLNDAILLNAGMAIVATKPDGTITSFNRAAEAMLGYSADEVIGKMTPDSFHGRDKLFHVACPFAEKGKTVTANREGLERITDIIQGGAEEWQMRRKDGTAFEGMLSLSTFLDADGDIGGIIGVARDITQEKKMIAELKASEERFHRMFHDNAAMMLLVDTETGVIEEANRAAAAYYGYDFYGDKKLEITDIEAQPRDQVKKLIAYARAHRINTLAGLHKLASGALRDVELHITPIQDVDRTLHIIIIHDVTDRLKAEQALRRSEAENRAIVQAVPDRMFRLDQDGTILNAFAGDETDLLLPKETLLKKNVRDVLTADVAASTLQALGKAFREKNTVTFEYAADVNGTTNRYESRTIAISEHEALAIVRNITDRYNAEQAVRRNESLLKMMTLATPQAFYIVDERTDEILYFNMHFCTMWRMEHLAERMSRNALRHPSVLQEHVDQVLDPRHFLQAHATLSQLDSRVVSEDEIHLKDSRILRCFSSQIRGSGDEYYGRLFIYEDITRSKTEAKILEIQRDLATRLSATSDLSGALQCSLDALLEIEHIACAGIYLFNPLDGNLELVAHRNVTEDFVQNNTRYTSDNTVYQLVKAGRAAIVDVENIAAEARTFSFPERIQGVAVIPIRFEGQMIGSCNLMSEKSADFIKKFEDLLEMVAGQIGFTISRIHAEQALFNSQQNFRTLFETIDDFVFILDSQGKIIATNPIVRMRLGYQEDELSRMHIYQLHPADHQPDALSQPKETMAGLTSYCHLPLETKHGEAIPVETRILAGRWDGQHVLFAISRDLSERQKAAKALQESEDRWQFALEGSGDGVWDWNLESNTVYYSKQWKLMLGFQEDEISNHINEWSNRVHPDDLEQCFHDIGMHLRGETDVYANEHRLRHKDGRNIWVLDRGKVIEKAQDGKPLRMIGTHTDINKLKLMEQSLRETVDQQKELNDMKTKFISVTSHEFRTPLATIMVATESLLAYHMKMSMDQQGERLHKIKSQVQDLNKIIEDLLQISRLQSTDASLQPVEFDFAALCREVIESMKPQTAALEVEFISSQAGVVVLLDKKLVTMIISNLISNAVKYSAPKNRIAMNLESHQDRLVFTITDQGIGIPDKDLKHLFLPFFRASNVGTIGGTGLGLNIVKESVLKLGGNIDVASSVNEGTIFAVQLPLRMAVESP